MSAVIIIFTADISAMSCCETNGDKPTAKSCCSSDDKDPNECSEKMDLDSLFGNTSGCPCFKPASDYDKEGIVTVTSLSSTPQIVILEENISFTEKPRNKYPTVNHHLKFSCKTYKFTEAYII